MADSRILLRNMPRGDQIVQIQSQSRNLYYFVHAQPLLRFLFIARRHSANDKNNLR
jgi:hypothetical protein